jgi:hypothetical protein
VSKWCKKKNKAGHCWTPLLVDLYIRCFDVSHTWFNASKWFRSHNILIIYCSVYYYLFPRPFTEKTSHSFWYRQERKPVLFLLFFYFWRNGHHLGWPSYCLYLETMICWRAMSCVEQSIPVSSPSSWFLINSVVLLRVKWKLPSFICQHDWISLGPSVCLSITRNNVDIMFLSSVF